MPAPMPERPSPNPAADVSTADRRVWATPALTPLDVFSETGTGLTETFSEKTSDFGGGNVFYFGPTTS